MLAEMRTTDPKAYDDLIRHAAPTPNTEAILWRIEKSGVAPSNLLGTAHLSDERITTLSPQIKLAVTAARTMALEVADLSPESMATAVATCTCSSIPMAANATARCQRTSSPRPPASSPMPACRPKW
jgi:uncharacterized protein YbaP (TraB family)